DHVGGIGHDRTVPQRSDPPLAMPATPSGGSAVPPTHVVINQVSPLVGHDVSAADPALRAALAAAGAPLDDELQSLAVDAGSAEVAEGRRLADTNPPVLRTHDRGGARVDEVDYHPAWHQLMARAVGAGLQAAPW